MKSLTSLLILSLTALAHGDLLSESYDHATMCGFRNKWINQAIAHFCASPDIHVPSEYAHNGYTIGAAHVAILGGHCPSSEWVPPEWCKAQFEAICANRPNGFGWQRFNGCQIFIIHDYTGGDVVDPV